MKVLIACDFNSHAHVERDFWIACGIVYDIDFNSHAHVERDGTLNWVAGDSGNFNSHAHVERDPQTIAQSYNHCISTHTLTWSVTLKPPTGVLYL